MPVKTNVGGPVRRKVPKAEDHERRAKRKQDEELAGKRLRGSRSSWPSPVPKSKQGPRTPQRHAHLGSERRGSDLNHCFLVDALSSKSPHFSPKAAVNTSPQQWQNGLADGTCNLVSNAGNGVAHANAILWSTLPYFLACQYFCRFFR